MARLDVDLAAARDTLAALAADGDGAAAELAHAASRVVGIATGVPVPDLDALGAWLDRIADGAAVPGRQARVAADLDGWRAAAEARRAEIDAGSAPPAPGCAAGRRARGLWTALRAKAGARKLDENPASPRR